MAANGKARAPEGIVRVARRLLGRIEAMQDPSPDARCRFSPWPCGDEPMRKVTDAQIKERIRPYVASWVEPDVRALLEYLSGEKSWADLKRERDL